MITTKEPSNRNVVRTVSNPQVIKAPHTSLVDIAGFARCKGDVLHGCPNTVAFVLYSHRSAVRKRNGFAAIHYKPYFVESETEAAPLSLTYRRLKASAKPCAILNRNLAYNPQNTNYKNFGCATQNNLAAMIAEPRDLTVPRGTDPRSSERRMTIYDKYIKGQPTGAERSEEEKSKVSEVAK